MRINIDGAQLPVTVFAVEAVAVEDWAAKKKFGTEEMKTDDAGRQLFSTRKSLVVLGERGAETGVTLSVLSPEPLDEMTKYVPAGKVTFTPWVNNGRVAVSLIVERLERLDGKKIPA
jgi:hypothetical protein